jgi:uncharacterized SAM-binding protein YcdF (DUF218 family)
MTANYLLWWVLKPSQLLLLGALLAIVCWRRRIGHTVALATIGAVVVFGVLPTGTLLLEPLQARFDTPQSLATVDGVIVLAGSEQTALIAAHSDPQIGAGGDRLTTFLMLAARFPQARLVHSGSPKEAQIARTLVLGTGVAPERIRFDTDARNTCDSAHTVRALMGPQGTERWLLVTSAFHMPRAIACFRAAGWDVIAYPTDFRRGLSSWSPNMVSNLDDLDLATHEWIGLVYYRLRGRTSDVFPRPRSTD